MPSSLSSILGIEIAVFAVLGFLFWFFVIRVLSKEKRSRRQPFTKELLNAPGESLVRKVQDLQEVFNDHLTILMALAGGMIGYSAGLLSDKEGVNTALLIALVGIAGVIAASVMMVKIRNNRRLQRQYRLGLLGEQHVAQALAPLLSKGYTIYHDLPFRTVDGRSFNIDHVLVGPGGVVAVETKARNKDPEAKGKNAAVVKYDGKNIEFPSGRSEEYCLSQSLAGAKTLSKELSAAEGSFVPVRAVVCLPGWFVTTTVREAEPFVCNPEQISRWVETLPRHQWDGKTTERICATLRRLAVVKSED